MRRTKTEFCQPRYRHPSGRIEKSTSWDLQAFMRINENNENIRGSEQIETGSPDQGASDSQTSRGTSTPLSHGIDKEITFCRTNNQILACDVESMEKREGPCRCHLMFYRLCKANGGKIQGLLYLKFRQASKPRRVLGTCKVTLAMNANKEKTDNNLRSCSYARLHSK